MIETERLILRPPTAEDLPWVLAHMNTPGVMRHLGGVRLEATVAERLASDIADVAVTRAGRWIIWLREGERRVGRCGLFTLSSEAAPEVMRGQPEIGWTLAEPYWGHGYATEAARAVLAFGFETLGHRIIYSQTSASNAASTRLMGRLGLVRMRELDYVDPEYPSADNPTTVYRLERPPA